MTSFKTGYYSKLIFFEREREKEKVCVQKYLCTFCLLSLLTAASSVIKLKSTPIQFNSMTINFYTLKSFFHEDKKSHPQNYKCQWVFLFGVNPVLRSIS